MADEKPEEPEDFQELFDKLLEEANLPKVPYTLTENDKNFLRRLKVKVD
jgi:hypothetical protein